MQNIFYIFAVLKKEETVDFYIKTVWLSIARMYHQQAMKSNGTMSIGYALLNISWEEGTPAMKIGPAMGLEPRSLTRLVKLMEEKGLIFREIDKKDRRSVRVFLTQEGKEMKEKSRAAVLLFNKTIRETIPDDKIGVFFEVMKEINQVVEKMKFMND